MVQRGDRNINRAVGEKTLFAGRIFCKNYHVRGKKKKKKTPGMSKINYLIGKGSESNTIIKLDTGDAVHTDPIKISKMYDSKHPQRRTCSFPN